jgi:5'-nucleotidase
MNMVKKNKILLTNDDGIAAPGLLSLWKAVEGFSDTVVVAPDSNFSGAGVGITLKKPLRLSAVPWGKGENTSVAWSVNGKPADCVKLGVSVVLQENPDLIISGINDQSNLGRTVFYSGTVGGVIEGALKGIPGIAFSYYCGDFGVDPDDRVVKEYVAAIVQHVLHHPLPFGTILNVNFPDLSKIVRGIKLARQGLGYWSDNLEKRIHPNGNTPYFWLGEKWHYHEESLDSDVALLQKGYITAVPLCVKELTCENMMRDHKESFETKLNDIFVKS